MIIKCFPNNHSFQDNLKEKLTVMHNKIINMPNINAFYTRQSLLKDTEYYVAIRHLHEVLSPKNDCLNNTD